MDANSIKRSEVCEKLRFANIQTQLIDICRPMRINLFEITFCIQQVTLHKDGNLKFNSEVDHSIFVLLHEIPLDLSESLYAWHNNI